MPGGIEPSDDGGMKHRKSSEHSDRRETLSSEGGESSNPGRRTLSGEDGPIVQTSGTDVQNRVAEDDGELPDKNSSVTDAHASVVSGKQRKSSEIAGGPGSAGHIASADLSLSTTAAAAVPASESTTGPGNESSSSRNNESTSLTRSSPVSPRARNRGLSLRSSLFARTIDRRSQNEDPIIEMRGIGSPGEPTGRPQPSKNTSEASVTVSPVPDEASTGNSYDPPLADLTKVSSWKRFQGTYALPHYQQWVQEQARCHLPLQPIKEAYGRARKFVLRIKDIPTSKDGRHLLVNAMQDRALVDDRTNQPFIDNYIRSSKYTPWNFLPRQLFFQFSKLANFYFLIVSILQMIPGLSTTGTYTTIVPLMCFVSLSMAKEGYEDFRRHRLDKAENNQESKVLHAPGLEPKAKRDILAITRDGLQNQGPIQWVTVKWQSLQVGDIVKLDRDEAVPADIVLLSTKGNNNIVYIETMALDGETNLKTKQPSPALRGACDTIEGLTTSQNIEMVVEDPNLDLYNFEGRIAVDGSEPAPLTNNEILYRGSILRNTPEVVGMIIYSGEECKIRMNANKNPRIKAPTLQSVVNKIVIGIVCFVVALSLFNTVAYQIWASITESEAWYLTDARVPFGQELASFIIMFNTLIPLSLYVILEIIKLGQMWLLNDIDMYDEASNTPFEARTSTINEELGQVSYIFSDKTGTLTENVMKFRNLSVAGIAWSHDVEPKESEKAETIMHQKPKTQSKGKNPLKRLGRKSTDVQGTLSGEATPRLSTATRRSSAAPNLGPSDLTTIAMVQYIQHHPQSAFARNASMMILSLALCHTCLPERTSDNEDINYQAASPDELALVQAARELGYVAYDRQASTLTLKTYPNGLESEPMYEAYEILDGIEFSSKR